MSDSIESFNSLCVYVISYIDKDIEIYLCKNIDLFNLKFTREINKIKFFYTKEKAENLIKEIKMYKDIDLKIKTVGVI